MLAFQLEHYNRNGTYTASVDLTSAELFEWNGQWSLALVQRMVEQL